MGTRNPATEEKLEQLWSVRLPNMLDPWAPQLADAFADGAWTAACRGLGAFAPLAGLAVGFLVPFVYPGVRYVYSESLVFMVLVIASAILSGPGGAMLLFGYVVGDLLGGTLTRSYFGSSVEYFLRRGGSQLISYLLLAIPAVLVPLLARRIARQVPLDRLPSDPTIRLAARAGLYAAGCGALVYLWCQAMIVLIRPVFTWVNSQPTVEAIRYVQVWWDWLVTVGMLAAVARVMLEEVIARRSPRMAVVAELQRQRGMGNARRGELGRRLPVAVRIGIASLAVTLLLAGTYVSWADAVIVMVASVVLGVWHARLIIILPSGWTTVMHRVPALLRLVAAPLVGYVLANIVIGIFWRTESFRPVMLGALLTLVVFHLFFPPRPAIRSNDGRETR